jgi:ATP-dependent DNA helicase RecG
MTDTFGSKVTQGRDLPRAQALAQLPAPDRPLQFLPGVGPRLAPLLREKLGLTTLSDLWFHLPLHYEDRTRITPMGAAQPGVSALFEGTIEHAEVVLRGRRMLLASMSDGTGRIALRFFYFQMAQLEKFKTRPRVRVFGEARDTALGFEIVHPKITFLTEAPLPVSESLTPVYPKAEGITAERIASAVQAAMKELPAALSLELIEPEMLATLKWPALKPALSYVHAPPPGADVLALEERRHPAQRRLAGEELLAHQLSMQLKRNRLKSERAPSLSGGADLRQALLAGLGFSLTGAQSRVVKEILADVKRAQPMLRLVQGDVGSGKTIVAALAACAAIDADTQVALVAPTELLAEQHFRNFTRWFAPLGITPVWLAGKVQGKARIKALSAIADGAHVVIGTHALMSEAVQFKNLSLCVIDEQHRFGVHQRLELRQKGARGAFVPHQLVMTATPIPRTLAMVGYADLDVSVIDELPPGRKPIQTVVLSVERRLELIERIRSACAAGRQAYWVCTLIEESDLLEAQAAQVAAELLMTALPELRIGLVHGRLKAKEKDAVMQQFARAELDVLVATTVIEVGVDVPNASLMLIENAERLGLSQLHQLRGRVGRGSAQSSCVLMYQTPLSQMAKARLAILRDSNDGFVIAERDLELRGAGELLGTKQTGDARFRIADLNRDMDLVELAQSVTAHFAERFPAQSAALVRRWVGAAERYSQA